MVDDFRVFVTNVYTPCVDTDREEFFAELLSLAPLCDGSWLLAGDFNIARRPEERNNGTFDAGLASAFNAVLDRLLVQEMPLLDCKFTWSNMREQATMVRLDRAFINLAWSTVLCDSALCSAVRETSDHVPMIVSASPRVPSSPLFRYEKGWAFYDEYRSLVSRTSTHHCNQLADPMLRLSKKLKWVRAESTKWARSRFRPDVFISTCRAVSEFVDRLEESRWLSATESLLRTLVKKQLATHLKIKSLYWRQRPRQGMLWKGHSKYSGGDCQVAWRDVCHPCSEGGLGVRDLRVQNLCLLMKFVHKLVSGEVTPWTRWVRRWYGEYGISHAPSVHDTPSWRTFKHVFATYRQLTSVVVGTGCTVSFWLDNWCRVGPLFARLPALFSHCTLPNISLADALRSSGLSLPLCPRLTAVVETELVALSAALREFPLSDAVDMIVASLAVQFSRQLTPTACCTSQAFRRLSAT
ncbi:hypothetical protein ACQ4PT_001812 [Festuca glaucescens]